LINICEGTVAYGSISVTTNKNTVIVGVIVESGIINIPRVTGKVYIATFIVGESTIIYILLNCQNHRLPYLHQ
jgi:hypothetical protein